MPGGEHDAGSDQDPGASDGVPVVDDSSGVFPVSSGDLLSSDDVLCAGLQWEEEGEERGGRRGKQAETGEVVVSWDPVQLGGHRMRVAAIAKTT